MKRSFYSSQAGFTLIEITIALAIMSMGILSAMSILTPAVKWGANAREEFGAAQAIQSAIINLNAGGRIIKTDTKTGIYVGGAASESFPYLVEVSIPTSPASLVFIEESSQNRLKKSSDGPADRYYYAVTFDVYRRTYNPVTGIYSISKIDSDPSTGTVDPIFSVKADLCFVEN